MSVNTPSPLGDASSVASLPPLGHRGEVVKTGNLKKLKVYIIVIVNFFNVTLMLLKLLCFYSAMSEHTNDFFNFCDSTD